MEMVAVWIAMIGLTVAVGCAWCQGWICICLTRGFEREVAMLRDRIETIERRVRTDG